MAHDISSPSQAQCRTLTQWSPLYNKFNEILKPDTIHNVLVLGLKLITAKYVAQTLTGNLSCYNLFFSGSNLLSLRNNLSFCIHLLYALLCGRPVVVFAEPKNERFVYSTLTLIEGGKFLKKLWCCVGRRV